MGVVDEFLIGFVVNPVVCRAQPFYIFNMERRDGAVRPC